MKSAGKSEAEIQQELDRLYPENVNARVGELAEEKSNWRLIKNLEIDWRIPKDASRVMIFE